ncbi:MAG: C4-dicarboxylate ABC transporter substrate-binding protein [Gammaproteobacteria bacterium]|nr:C4-dicarboxylate ABC transporter substrate-binding protein [Gammaproteobacteria bacterium]
MLRSELYRPIHLIVLIFCSLLFGASVFAADRHKWKMATSWGGGPLMELGAKAFANKVELLTEGRVKVQVFAGGTLGKALKVSETVKNGVAQAGHTWMGYDWGKDKATVVFGGFAGSMDSERMLHWLYEGGGLDMWREFRMQKFGVVSMPLFIRTAEAFLHSNKAVQNMDDLKGLKVRTAGAWLEISRSMGAAPVTMPGAEVFTSLERGAIDATEWGTLYENISPGFHKIAKYVVIPGVHQPVAPFELVINKDAYDVLSERDRQLVALAAKLVTFESWTRIGHEDAKALQFFRDSGNEIIELEESVQRAVKTTSIEWGKNQGKENTWFKKAYDSQLAYENLWKDAARYRNVAQ